MADDYVCDCCKKTVDTIYFYRPLCEKCYRQQKEKDKEAESALTGQQENK